MKIKSFYDEFILDSEPSSSLPSLTVPDQSLSVRDILLSYSRGQMSLPSIDTGDDETFDDDVNSYDDLIDAHNALLSSSDYLSSLEVPSGDAPSGDAPSGDVPSGDSPSGDAPKDGALS